MPTADRETHAYDPTLPGRWVGGILDGRLSIATDGGHIRSGPSLSVADTQGLSNPIAFVDFEIRLSATCHRDGPP